MVRTGCELSDCWRAVASLIYKGRDFSSIKDSKLRGKKYLTASQMSGESAALRYLGSRVKIIVRPALSRSTRYQLEFVSVLVVNLEFAPSDS